MIPYDQLPEDRDHRTHMSFIKTELAARAGLVATGTSASISFLAFDPVITLIAKCVTIVVGVLTATYYALAIAEKWRNLNKDEE